MATSRTWDRAASAWVAAPVPRSPQPTSPTREQIAAGRMNVRHCGQGPRRRPWPEETRAGTLMLEP